MRGVATPDYKWSWCDCGDCGTTYLELFVPKEWWCKKVLVLRGGGATYKLGVR